MECNIKINLSNSKFKSCGDLGINMDELLTSNVSDMKTVKEFDNILCSEFIDVKSRKVLSSYPTLKAFYERYKTSFQGNPQSSAYNYLNMNQFVKLVGDYWIDLIEQVIPSTTIWGSTYKHRNIIFDKQKFKYKRYTLQTCGNVSGVLYPSPTSGSTNNVGVEVTDVTLPQFVGPDCLKPSGETTTCSSVYIEQINHGSEFIGKVNIIGNPSDNSTGDTIVITECDLIINNIESTISKESNSLTFTPTYVGGVGPYTYDWTISNSSGEFTSWSIVSGTEDNEIVELSGDPILSLDGDTICVSLTITDSNDCSYSLSSCYVANSLSSDSNLEIS
jgi:hypothetical protein